MSARVAFALAWLIGCGYEGSSPAQQQRAMYEASKVDPVWRPFTTMLGLSPGTTEKSVVEVLGEPSRRTVVADGVSALQWAMPGDSDAAPSMVTALIGADGLRAVGVTGTSAAAEMKARGHGDGVLTLLGLPIESALPQLPAEATAGRRAARARTPEGQPPIRVDLRTDVSGKVQHVGISWIGSD